MKSCQSHSRILECCYTILPVLRKQLVFYPCFKYISVEKGQEDFENGMKSQYRNWKTKTIRRLTLTHWTIDELVQCFSLQPFLLVHRTPRELTHSQLLSKQIWYFYLNDVAACTFISFIARICCLKFLHTPQHKYMASLDEPYYRGQTDSKWTK